MTEVRRQKTENKFKKLNLKYQIYIANNKITNQKCSEGVPCAKRALGDRHDFNP